MPNSIDETIKTVTSLPWDGVAKLIIVAAIIIFGYGEYREDALEGAGADRGDDQYELLRDLSVSQITATEALRASIERQEIRQDTRIDNLEDQTNR